ncbi:hypothetical protein FA10DRAFT_281951 [Acaromyces ingoldii]|uniref:Uncharacterized protein n=1 Tax=Acaromyces ingoldii TaxID=215250 RepID=A0A316YDJ0_9BASI|nr:hypothetical protein FA10DRAFT_281951 [Acaromyces ingoldii]PWN87201.1 hypothetical protein FA10DRAFT_281951 [Acaromyces ingoldii]
MFSHTASLLVLALSAIARGQLTITQATAEDAANSLFGESYDLGTITSAGNAAQIGTFSGGNAAGFGIDSGIILSSGSLTGVSDDYGGAGDSSIAYSVDAASIVTTIQAKATSNRDLATFGSVFCTCENAAGTDSFNERAQVLLNNEIVYDRQRGVEDTRPTGPFGFAAGDDVAYQGGPCKCSPVANFNLPRPSTPTDLKVVIADTGDGSFNSWIFLGFVGFQDLDVVSTTLTTTAATQTATTTETTTATESTTTATTTTLTALTTLPAVTNTVTAATSTVTAVNAACTNYVLQFEANCCPRSLCKKKSTLPHRRQVDLASTITSTTTFTETDTLTTTETSVVPTTLTITDTLTNTESTTATVTPTPSTSTFVPVATTTVCKTVKIPKFICPRSLKAASLLSAAEKAFLDFYAKSRPKNAPQLEVHCDNDKQVYLYP